MMIRDVGTLHRNEGTTVRIEDLSNRGINRIVIIVVVFVVVSCFEHIFTCFTSNNILHAPRSTVVQLNVEVESKISGVTSCNEVLKSNSSGQVTFEINNLRGVNRFFAFYFSFGNLGFKYTPEIVRDFVSTSLDGDGALFGQNGEDLTAFLSRVRSITTIPVADANGEVHHILFGVISPPREMFRFSQKFKDLT